MLEDLIKSRLARKSDVADIITFAEADWGLDMELFPAQKFILKCIHGLPLDTKDKTIKIYRDPFKENVERELTEYDYMLYLQDEGRMSPDYEVGQERRETVLAIGRRAGKTRLSSVIIVYNIYKLLSMYDPQDHYVIPKGDKIGFAAIATSQDQARELFAPVRAGVHFSKYIDNKLIRGSSDYELKMMSKHDFEVQGPKGMPSIQAMAYPCSARGVRGAANMVVVFDEFAHFILAAGNRSDEEVYKAATPSVTSFKDDGKIVSISSPLGKAGKFYDLFTLGMEGDESILSIQAPCWEINERVDTKILKSEFRKDRDGFLNEYGATWSGHVVDFIRDPEIYKRNVNPERVPIYRGDHRKVYYLGLDVGLADDSTGIAIGHSEDGQIIVDLIEELVPPGVVAAEEGIELPDEESVLKLDHIAKRISELTLAFNIQKGIYDHYNGYGLGEALVRHGMTVGEKGQFEMLYFNRGLNSQLYKLIKQMLFENRITFYPDEDFQNEFLKLQETKYGGHEIKVEAPSGAQYHDDRSDALVRMVKLVFDAMSGDVKPAWSSSIDGNTFSPGNHPDGLPNAASPSSVRLYHRKRESQGHSNPRYKLLAAVRGGRKR